METPTKKVSVEERIARIKLAMTGLKNGLRATQIYKQSKIPVGMLPQIADAGYIKRRPVVLWGVHYEFIAELDSTQLYHSATVLWDYTVTKYTTSQKMKARKKEKKQKSITAELGTAWWKRVIKAFSSSKLKAELNTLKTQSREWEEERMTLQAKIQSLQSNIQTLTVKLSNVPKITDQELLKKWQESENTLIGLRRANTLMVKENEVLTIENRRTALELARYRQR